MKKTDKDFNFWYEFCLDFKIIDNDHPTKISKFFKNYDLIISVTDQIPWHIYSKPTTLWLTMPNKSTEALSLTSLYAIMVSLYDAENLSLNTLIYSTSKNTNEFIRFSYFSMRTKYPPKNEGHHSFNLIRSLIRHAFEANRYHKKALFEAEFKLKFFLRLLGETLETDSIKPGTLNSILTKMDQRYIQFWA